MSLEEPFPTERLADPQFEELIRHLCTRPGMLVIPASFATVCAYIDGFNGGAGGGPLLGLREWLVVRLNGGNNVHWIGLAERFIAKDLDEPGRIRALGELIGEYLRYRRDRGITK